MRCADALHCAVVTGGNIVEYTDDGFATLNPATRAGGGPDSRVPANAAAYSSPLRAVAVGELGDTWHSDDGGHSFSRDYLSLGFVYHRVRATSPSVAYAPGESGKVAKTTDAGGSWKNVGVPTANGIADVSFPTATLGYALDNHGSLFGTDNGGSSWTILGQPGPGGADALWSSQDGGTVLIVTFGILRSTDGGQTFTPISSKLVSEHVFTDVDRAAGGIVVAYGPGVIVRSSDGGQTWRRIRRPRKRPIAEVDFVSAKIGFALTQDGRVWRTRNGGRRWRELLGVGTRGGYAMSFGDASHGWIAVGSFAGADGGWLLRTSDGGATWRPQLVDDAGVSVDGIAGTSDTTGFALTDSSHFFATQSGGDSGSPSSLSLRARRLRHRRARASGKLSPAVGGARIAVFARAKNAKRWRRQLVTTDSGGRFTTAWRIRRLTFFVAQWAGDQRRGGAGSRVARAKPRR